MSTIIFEDKEVYVGFVKQPLMKAPEKGYLGVKIQNIDRTEIMCNECGKFFKRLHTKHLWNKHGLTMQAYKEKNGYSKTSSLLADSESLAISKKILGKAHSINKNTEALKISKEKHAKAIEEGKSTWKLSNERQNAYGTCFEQVKDRLRNYVERFGQLPTYNAYGEDGIAIYSLLKHRYGDINEGFKAYGLPTKRLFPGSHVEYKFKDGETINIGYQHNNNWGKLIEKIKETSPIFKTNLEKLCSSPKPSRLKTNASSTSSHPKSASPSQNSKTTNGTEKTLSPLTQRSSLMSERNSVSKDETLLVMSSTR